MQKVKTLWGEFDMKSVFIALLVTSTIMSSAYLIAISFQWLTIKYGFNVAAFIAIFIVVFTCILSVIYPYD